MARLFITPREIDFISDITKEVIKDIIGQKIFYYRVRDDLSSVHDIYEESRDKIFDPPIDIDAIVDWRPQEFKTNKFGVEEMSMIDIYIHRRDLIDKDLEVRTGGYFSFGRIFFEITSANDEKNLFGQVEYTVGTKLVGKQARRGAIDKVALGPTDEAFDDVDATQKEFVQQRGQAENSNGVTNDIRQLQKDNKLDSPLSGPQEVSERGDTSGVSSSFYDEK